MGFGVAIWEKILSLLYPAADNCVFCMEKAEPGTMLCRRCRCHLEKWSGQDVCARCGRRKTAGKMCPCRAEMTYYRRVLAAAPYSGPFKQAAHSLKYRQETSLATLMGRIMGQCLVQELPSTDLLLVPVPLSARKLALRGYNQALLLARAVSKETSFPVRNVLVKDRDTLPQVALKREQRQVNLQGVFRVGQAEAIAGRTVVLVDDIFTTGTTVNEAARVLRAANAEEVFALVWAMG